MDDEDKGHAPTTSTPVMAALRNALRAEIHRTGVTILALSKEAPGLPPDLTPRVVNRWLSGLSKLIDRSQAELLLAVYGALPDATPGSGRPVSSKKQPLTAAMQRDLEAELIRTGATVASLAEARDGMPPGLNARVIRSWVYGEAKSVAPSHWAFVMEGLAKRANSTGIPFSCRPEPPGRADR